MQTAIIKKRNRFEKVQTSNSQPSVILFIMLSQFLWGDVPQAVSGPAEIGG